VAADAPEQEHDVLAPRYLSSFRCLADACDDTCCDGWNVTIDPPTFARWQAALGPARTAAIVDDARPGRLRLRVLAGGRCGQLGDDRLCAIQRELGEDALADTCALFPRLLQAAGDRLEATATLACPEIARRSLLGRDGAGADEDDDAHALVALPRTGALARAPHTRVAADAAARPWIAAGPALRDAIDRALADPAWPIATRLFALARLADATRAVFHADADPAGAQTFAAALGGAFTPAALAAADVELGGDAPAAFAGVAIVTDLLATRLASPTAPALRAAIERALAGADTPDGEVCAAGRRLSPARLWAVHDARLAALPDAVLARLDAIDAAWARHAWRQRWHLFALDLFTHGLLHLVDRAVARALLAAHPRLADDVDGAAVEVIHLVVRHFEHAGLHDPLAARLAADGHATRAVARALLLI
jgi:lysine-N-methylase